MVLVAIPVHQRGDLVRRCFQTAAELELPPGGEIGVFDDASPSLDVPGLIAATSLSCTFERSPTRLGASGMIVHVWERFLSSDHEALLFLDSDMIANRDALLVAERLAKRAGGLLSLYNSWMHAGQAIDAELVAKATVGNGGTYWSRDLARIALERADRDNSIDFSYCRIFVENAIPIAATSQSRVQHLGISGTNNNQFGKLDYGLGFVPDSPLQMGALAFVHNELMQNQAHYLPPETVVSKSPSPGLLSRLIGRARRR